MSCILIDNIVCLLENKGSLDNIEKTSLITKQASNTSMSNQKSFAINSSGLVYNFT